MDSDVMGSQSDPLATEFVNRNPPLSSAMTRSFDPRGRGA
jgi:hypothetical protein